MVEARLLRATALVKDRRRALARDVLHERAAHGDVDDLQAAADAEDRKASAPGLTEQAEVEGVALGVHFDGAVLEPLLAVARRIHVHAAAEQERVERPDVGRERRRDRDRAAGKPASMRDRT